MASIKEPPIKTKDASFATTESLPAGAAESTSSAQDPWVSF
jgi:hypothetical protein